MCPVISNPMIYFCYEKANHREPRLSVEAVEMRYRKAKDPVERERVADHLAAGAGLCVHEHRSDCEKGGSA